MPKPVAGFGPPAIGQRDAEPASLMPSDRPQRNSTMPMTGRPGPFAAQQQPFVQIRRQVVVAHQPHVGAVRHARPASSRPDRAAGTMWKGTARRGRRRRQARQAGRRPAAVPACAGAAPPGRRPVGPGIAAARDEPGLIGGPGALPARVPFRAGRWLADGVEGQCQVVMSGHSLLSKKKRIISALASGPFGSV